MMADEVDHDDDGEQEADERHHVNLVLKAPSLYERPVYFRQTRKRGKILKTVCERYIRDDINFGTYFSTAESLKQAQSQSVVVGSPRNIETSAQLLSLLRPCTPLSLVICDTNVLLHNLDVLEQASKEGAIPNIVIPQTALLECRANQVTAYDRTVELFRSGGRVDTEVGQSRLVIFFADQHHVETAHLEKDDDKDNSAIRSINDENDVRIRNVAAFFADQLQGTNVRVILLTDDAASRAQARSAQFEAKTVRSWIQELETVNPNLSLSDLVAQYSVQSKGAVLRTDAAQHEEYFPAHLDASTLSRGVQSGIFHRGVLRSTDPSVGLVTIRQGEERVFVTIQGPVDRNRAVDGDVVAISLNPLDQWLSSAPSTRLGQAKDETVGIASETADPTQSDLTNVPDVLSVEALAKSLKPTGKVVGILRRNFCTYCGSIYEKSSSEEKSPTTEEHDELISKYEAEHADGTTTCVFFPMDKRISPILIRTSQRDRLLSQRILVSMDSWPSNSPLPLGHYVKAIGLAGSKDVETEVLLQQHKIPHEAFPAAVMACLPSSDYNIVAEDTGRLDLRHLPVLSIDPPGCKDIDDALHCTVLPNNNYQIGVHIADVTHYVKAGTAIDLEAANRSTSTYLVNKRLDMLPGLLTTDLCSLKGNVDRYAFSVLWEVTPTGDIVDVEFKKTIIHSIAALTYQQAQSFIDQPEADDIQVAAVKRLAALARIFRKRRIDAGALTLASPEVKFVLDSESLNPTDVQAYALLEANALVEEFMLLANVTVAKKILRHYPTLSVLRRHPAPNRAMFESLISKAKCRGFDINIDDSKRLADSLDAAVMESGPYFNKLLRILSTRCMSPAQYFCSGEFKPTEWHHYGLAAPVYTHFTSPIRRYADVCVHRLLAAAIGVAPLPIHLSSKSYLHDLCANMNRRHRSAQLAGRDSVQLHTLIFFAGDGAKEEDAYVLDVQTSESSDPSFTVIIPRYGIEGRVYLPISGDDPHLAREPAFHRLTYKVPGADAKLVQVFDKVQVRIWVRQIQDQRELVLDLISPRFGEATANAGKRDRSSNDEPHEVPVKRTKPAITPNNV